MCHSPLYFACLPTYHFGRDGLRIHYCTRSICTPYFFEFPHHHWLGMDRRHPTRGLNPSSSSDHRRCWLHHAGSHVRYWARYAGVFLAVPEYFLVLQTSSHGLQITKATTIAVVQHLSSPTHWSRVSLGTRLQQPTLLRQGPEHLCSLHVLQWYLSTINRYASCL